MCNLLNIDEAVDTQYLQEESLMRFAAAMGYEVVMDQYNRIRRFKQPKFQCDGTEYISVKNMIRLHNSSAENVFEYVKTLDSETFGEFLDRRDREGRTMIELMFAGTCKIVRKIKGQATRKEGLVIQSNIVEFMTKQDFAQYGGRMK